VARLTGRCINSDVVSIGVTLLDVARATLWRWQERRPGGGKSDILEVPTPTWLLWERQSWRWKERRFKSGKSDVKRVQDIAIATVFKYLKKNTISISRPMKQTNNSRQGTSDRLEGLKMFNY
jgi:hypothetical protein